MLKTTSFIYPKEMDQFKKIVELGTHSYLELCGNNSYQNSLSDSSSISQDREIIKIFHKKYCEAEEYHCAHTFCFCLPSRKNEKNIYIY